MSGNTDPFLVLVDDIGALRRQIENLGVCCRTVLNPTLSR